MDFVFPVRVRQIEHGINEFEQICYPMGLEILAIFVLEDVGRFLLLYDAEDYGLEVFP